jgi:hypothetical protein
MTWHPILTREQSSMADTWTEYLCASPVEDGFVLGICTHELATFLRNGMMTTANLARISR